jgi:hypothetical protein
VGQSDEFMEFVRLVDAVISVSREAVEKRLQDHRQQSAANPRRRGPKQKAQLVTRDDSDSASR